KLRPGGTMRTAIGLAISALVVVSTGAHAGDANLDPSFGTSGIAALDGAGPDTGEDVAIQPDGGIVVVGGPGFTVHRFTTTGSLDGTFGSGGTTSVALGTPGAARAVALQGDGRIVAVGAADV